MSTINDRIAKKIETEKKKREQELVTPPKIQRGQVTGSKWVWTLGAVGIDLITAYAIWQITFWWYGIMWILAGAGGLIYSEWLRERIGNNKEQGNIGKIGVDVSGASIVVMALVAGGVYILGYTRNPFVEVFALASAVGLGCYHIYQSRQYHILDDEYIESNTEARNEADNERDIRTIHRAARMVEAEKVQDGLTDMYQQDHGAALIAALQTLGVDVEQVRLNQSNRTNVRVDSAKSTASNAPEPQKPVSEYPNWNLPAFLAELHLSREAAHQIIAKLKDENEAYQALKSHGIESMAISRGQFRNFYEALKKNPTNRQG